MENLGLPAWPGGDGGEDLVGLHFQMLLAKATINEPPFPIGMQAPSLEKMSGESLGGARTAAPVRPERHGVRNCAECYRWRGRRAIAIWRQTYE
jgi:hypothetical protein